MKGGRSWQQGLRLVGQLAQRQRQQQRPQCEPLIQFGIRDPPSVFQRKFPYLMPDSRAGYEIDVTLLRRGKVERRKRFLMRVSWDVLHRTLGLWICR